MKSQKIFKNYGITYFEAVNDVTALFENLNENHLLNVTKKEYKNRIKSFFVFLYTFQFDQIFRLLNTKKRYDIPEKNGKIRVYCPHRHITLSGKDYP